MLSFGFDITFQELIVWEMLDLCRKMLSLYVMFLFTSFFIPVRFSTVKSANLSKLKDFLEVGFLITNNTLR